MTWVFTTDPYDGFTCLETGAQVLIQQSVETDQYEARLKGPNGFVLLLSSPSREGLITWLRFKLGVDDVVTLSRHEP